MAGLHGTFGEVFGIAFGLEGISFFVEAIFIAIYVYGWTGFSRRAHFLTGIPIVSSGFAGSFNVIAVNGWMNDPTASTSSTGSVVNPDRGRADRREHVARARSTCTWPATSCGLHRGRGVRLRIG